MPLRELVAQLGQRRMAFVRADSWDRGPARGSPWRVVPGDADLASGIVQVGCTCIPPGATGRQDTEAVRKPGRHMHCRTFSASRHPDPPPEAWRATPDVHADVVDLTLDDADKFPLRPPDLQVQPPERPRNRARMIVLDERPLDAVLAVAGGVIGLHEEPAAVGEHLRLDDEDARDRGGVTRTQPTSAREREEICRAIVSICVQGGQLARLM